MGDGRAGLEVVTDPGLLADRHRVTRGQAGQPVVDARELDAVVVELSLAHPAGRQVDRPRPEHALGVEAAAVAPQLGIPDRLQHDPVRVACRVERVVGVGHVEHVARVDLEPAHLAERIVAAEHAQPRPVRVVPAVGHVLGATGGDVHAEHDRQVHEDHVVRGEREVVHHRQRLDLDGPVDHQFPVGVRAVVGDVWFEQVAVTEEVEFAGRRADLGVGGHGVDQLAAEVVGADGLEVVGDLVWQRRLDERQRPSRVVDDVRVGGRGAQVAGAVGVVEREGFDEAVGPDPPVAVPLGLTAFDANAVDHAVTGEPMSRRRARIRSVAQVPTVEFGRDGALDGQVGLGQFVGDGRVVAEAEDLAVDGQAGVRGGKTRGVRRAVLNVGHRSLLVAGGMKPCRQPDTPLPTCQ